MTAEPWFFVVSFFAGREHYGLELGDHKDTRARIKEKPPAAARHELPPGYEPTLDQAIAAYKAGTLPKPPARPAALEPKTHNSVKARLARQKAKANG